MFNYSVTKANFQPHSQADVTFTDVMAFTVLRDAMNKQPIAVLNLKDESLTHVVEVKSNDGETVKIAFEISLQN